MVEIARAASFASQLIIMDEPTSSLSEREADLLFALIGRLRQRGTSIIYVSHRLDEVLYLADRTSVLRDGQYIGTLTRSTATKDAIIRMMVGREISDLYPKQAASIGDPILEVRQLLRSGSSEPISFDLRSGEILGVFGLIGAGRTEMARAIFGLDSRTSGEVRVGGALVSIHTPRDAIRAGIGLVPEDRKSQGLVLGMTVRENITLPQLHRFTRLGLLSLAQERELARRMARQLDVRTPSLEQQTVNLSGGNQQKVVLARWLALKPRILIVDEPTRGIDVATKAQVHALLSQLACEGVGVLMISSELPEILGMSDRVLVLCQGKVAGQFTRENATPELIMRSACGEYLDFSSRGDLGEGAEYD
jgi:ABC-type sugar transport system ATPase subunit